LPSRERWPQLLTMIEEFIGRLDQIHAVFIDTNTAYILLLQKAQELFPTDEGTVSFGDGPPEHSQTKIRQTVTIENFKSRLNLSGQNMQIITSLCIVAIYQLWEDEYREKIANAIGLLKKEDLKLDIMGDIRRLRQAVIHHGNKRTEEFSRFKKLIYMAPRQTVTLDDQEFHNLIETIKRDLRALN